MACFQSPLTKPANAPAGASAGFAAHRSFRLQAHKIFVTSQGDGDKRREHGTFLIIRLFLCYGKNNFEFRAGADS